MDNTSGLIKFRLNSIAAIGILVSNVGLIIQTNWGFYILFIGILISLLATKLHIYSIVAILFFIGSLLLKPFFIPYHHLLFFFSLCSLFISVYYFWLKPQFNIIYLLFYLSSLIFICLIYFERIRLNFANDALRYKALSIFGAIVMTTYGIRFIHKTSKNLEDVIKLFIILPIPLQVLVSHLYTPSSALPEAQVNSNFFMYPFVFLLFLWPIYRLVINQREKT